MSWAPTHNTRTTADTQLAGTHLCALQKRPVASPGKLKTGTTEQPSASHSLRFFPATLAGSAGAAGEEGPGSAGGGAGPAEDGSAAEGGSSAVGGSSHRFPFWAGPASGASSMLACALLYVLHTVLSDAKVAFAPPNTGLAPPQVILPFMCAI